MKKTIFCLFFVFCLLLSPSAFAASDSSGLQLSDLPITEDKLPTIYKEVMALDYNSDMLVLTCRTLAGYLQEMMTTTDENNRLERWKHAQNEFKTLNMMSSSKEEPLHMTWTKEFNILKNVMNPKPDRVKEYYAHLAKVNDENASVAARCKAFSMLYVKFLYLVDTNPKGSEGYEKGRLAYLDALAKLEKAAEVKLYSELKGDKAEDEACKRYLTYKVPRGQYDQKTYSAGEAALKAKFGKVQVVAVRYVKNKKGAYEVYMSYMSRDVLYTCQGICHRYINGYVVDITTTPVALPPDMMTIYRNKTRYEALAN